MGLNQLASLVYVALGLLFITWFFANLMLRFRAGLTIGLSVTAFALGAFPLGISALAVSAVIAYLCMLYLLARSDSRPAVAAIESPNVLLIIGVALLLLAYLPLGGDTPYGRSKTALFALVVVMPVLGFATLAPLKPPDIRIMSRALVMAGLLTALFVIAHGGLDPVVNSFVELKELGSPITLSRVIGLGVVALLIPVMGEGPWRLSAFQRIVSFGLGLGLLAVIPLLGNRGAFFACISSLLLTLALMTLHRRGRGGLRLVLTIGAVGLFLLGILKMPTDSFAFGRVDYFLEKTVASYDSGRLSRFESAFQMFLDTNGLGVGTGGFATRYATSQGSRVELQLEGGRDYPHNVILEVGSELGALGLVVLGVWLLLCVKGLKRLAQSGSTSTGLLVAFWIYAILNAMVSGDVASNSAIWIFGAIPWFVELGSEGTKDLPRIRSITLAEIT
jgi:O-antigen ligase